MNLSDLILILDGYEKIFYSTENSRCYSRNELTIKDCIELANREIKRVSLEKDEEKINVLIEFKEL